MALACWLWRARLALATAPLPSRWVVTGLLVLAAGAHLWGERTLLGKEAGITMLVVLMSLKTLELRARRDALVVFFLGFFLVLTHFLYSQSLGTGLWLLVAVWGLLTALVLAHMPVGRPPLRAPAGVAARAALLGLPLMVVLFVLFPRIGPLWGLPQDAAGRTGLSGTPAHGRRGRAGRTTTAIAFRVRFAGAVPPPAAAVLARPGAGATSTAASGRAWRPPSRRHCGRAPSCSCSGAPLRYEMTLEPSRLPLLPLLEMTPGPPTAPPRASRAGLTLRPDRSGRSTAR